MDIEDYYRMACDFQVEAHRLLSKHEGSSSRAITNEQTYSKLSGLSIRQRDLMKEAIKCLEIGTYRSSHVAAWAAFMGYVQEKLGNDGYVELDRVRGWKVTNADELIETASDYVILGCLKDVGLITKSTLNSLRGLLAKRNECAHPNEYEPGLNDTLGYLSELVRRIEYLQSRNISL